MPLVVGKHGVVPNKEYRNDHILHTDFMHGDLKKYAMIKEDMYKSEIMQ